MKQTKTILFLLIAALSFSACDKNRIDPIDIEPPYLEGIISKVTLNEEQKAYVGAGNNFAIKSLKAIYEQEKKNVIFSPLSLQYALALTANGASGETAAEIVNTLGYGEDQKALNDYCNLLLKQLPALDDSVEVKLVNAVVVNDRFRVHNDFRKTAEKVYYAPVEYLKVTNKKVVVDRINEWAHRNTNGFISPFLNERDIPNNFAAAILNALYFKSKWSEVDGESMFLKEATLKSQPFYLDGGGQSKVDYMTTGKYLRYGKMGDNKILELPYAHGNYVMYIILPDSKGKNGVERLLSYMTQEKWSKALSSMSKDALVRVRLPKFEVENKYILNNTLIALGIRRAFDPGKAQLDKLLHSPGSESFYIDRVIQKARINVAEWGTEAAAVTAVMIGFTSTGPQPEKIVDFYADHPFVYTIVEKTSGVMLFAGVFNSL
ncbi:MAG: serpin family protein [Bacteroidales bacterium]|mgnify:CR=1 FL=1|nr:serpin family protein [Bacteroidales bacterium]